jgi:hypothetical protein
MALTPVRWLAALIVACLIGSIALMDTHPTSNWMRAYVPSYAHTPEQIVEQRRMELTGAARAAAKRYRLGQLVDSLGRVSAKTTAAPVRVMLDAALPTVATGPVDTLVSLATRDVRDSGRIGLDVFVVYDTVTRIRGSWAEIYLPVIDYVLPRTANDRCAVILRIGRNPKIDWTIAKVLRTEQAQQQLLGPCAYYRAFGMPGAQIDRWLRGGGWAFAGDGSWSMAAAPVEPRQIAWRSFFPRFETPLFDMNVDGAHCTEGLDDACERIVFGAFTQMRSRLRFLNDNVLQSPYPSLGRSRLDYNRRALGPRQPFLFADMVRLLGKDRFGRFWTSSEPPTAAFQAASGETITRWTSRWAASQYGPPPARGPGMRVWATALSILLIGVGIAVATRMGAERQFA